MNCPNCRVEVSPYAEMLPTGALANRCPKCSCQIHEPAPAVAIAVEAPRRAVLVVEPTPGPVGILELARRRRAEVGARIIELRTLEAEALILDRMIEAAEDVATDPATPAALAHRIQ